MHEIKEAVHAAKEGWRRGEKRSIASHQRATGDPGGSEKIKRSPPLPNCRWRCPARIMKRSRRC
jgi:hypothetical protein